MAGIYIYCEDAGAAAELVGFAQKSGKAANIIAFDEKTAAEVAGSGAQKVFLFKGESLLVENYAKAVAAFLQTEGAELFAVGVSDRGRDIAARVAGYLGCAMISDVSEVQLDAGKLTTTRMMYGGAVSLSEVSEGLAVVTIPSGKFEAAATGCAEIVKVQAEADSRVALLETACAVRTSVDLSAADKIVCIGLGVDKKEDLKMVEELAQAIGAEIGCTRTIAEERRWLPSYIGISGVSVKPSLYVSLGVSGQVQHVVGIRDSKIIVAINNNEKAPIFQAADYSIVGDLYEIAPLLTQEVKKG